jgi:hypothetical protein
MKQKTVTEIIYNDMTFQIDEEGDSKVSVHL